MYRPGIMSWEARRQPVWKEAPIPGIRGAVTVRPFAVPKRRQLWVPHNSHRRPLPAAEAAAIVAANAARWDGRGFEHENENLTYRQWG